MPNENHHAVYATCYAYNGLRLTFRIGLPVGWHRAQNRWNRLDTLRRSGRALRIRHGRAVGTAWTSSKCAAWTSTVEG